MRLVLLIVLAFLLQGFVSGLLGDSLPPPDLIYLATLLMAASVSPFLGLPLAFSVGLLQDLLSAGYPGLHAVGLLLAAYAYYRLSRLVHWDGFGRAGGHPWRQLCGQVAGASAGGAVAADGGFNPLTLWSVIVPEMLMTLLIAPLVLRVYQQLFASHGR